MIKNKEVKFILNGLLVTLSIPIVLGVVLFVFVLKYKTDYNFKDVMYFSTGSVAILTFIMHTVNGNKSSTAENDRLRETKDYQEKMLLNIKRQNSYDIISQFSKPEMVEPLRAYRDIKTEAPNLILGSNVEPLKEYLKGNPKDYSRLHLLFNFFENISLQVKNDFLEEEIIKDALHSMFYNVYSTMKIYIKDAQSEKGYDRCWDDFVQLSKKWGEPI